MKNPFKKPKAEPAPKGPKLMKVYRKDYRVGQSQIDVSQPGLKHPEIAEFHEIIPIPYNSPAAMANEPGVSRTPGGQTVRRVPKTIKTIFRDGVAEVEQRLATYLINEGLAWAKPQKPCNWTDPTRYAAAEAEA